MEFLEYIWLGKPLWMWLAFLGIVVTLLALDLGRPAQEAARNRC